MYSETCCWAVSPRAGSATNSRFLRVPPAPAGCEPPLFKRRILRGIALRIFQRPAAEAFVLASRGLCRYALSASTPDQLTNVQRAVYGRQGSRHGCHLTPAVS